MLSGKCSNSTFDHAWSLVNCCADPEREPSVVPIYCNRYLRWNGFLRLPNMWRPRASKVLHITWTARLAVHLRCSDGMSEVTTSGQQDKLCNIKVTAMQDARMNSTTGSAIIPSPEYQGLEVLDVTNVPRHHSVLKE